MLLIDLKGGRFQVILNNNNQGRRNDVKARGADFRERALLN